MSKPDILSFLNDEFLMPQPEVLEHSTKRESLFIGIPKELMDAARVDGLSWFGVYWKICMPLSKPVTLGAGLSLFVFQWESFLWPLIAAPSPDLHLIQVVLARFSTEYAPIWNQQFAASTIAGLLPLIFIYLFQKQFVSALTGVKQK